MASKKTVVAAHRRPRTNNNTKQPSSRPAPTRVLRLNPPLEFDVEHACVSADGARLALAGRIKKRRKEGSDNVAVDDDDDLYAARVVDVSSGGRPLPNDPAASSSSPTVRAFEAASSPLASALFASRPGLRVLQLTWHPLSPAHAVLLTSDSCLRLYRAAAADAPAPEQEFELAAALRSSGGSIASSSSGASPSSSSFSSSKAAGLPLGLRALSLSANASSSTSTSQSPMTPSFAAARRATGFAFGPPDWAQAPWERFTVYVQASDGAVFSLCPVAPFGAPLEGSAARALASCVAAGGSSSEARAWVQRALPSYSPPSSRGGAIVRIRPHALDEHSPALAGPLPMLVPGGGAGG